MLNTQENFKNYYVYRHFKKDSNSVFYIGLGGSENNRRAYEKTGRNKHWHNTVKKYGYDVEIISSDITEEQAIELEVFLIEFYGRTNIKTGKLVNKTPGGETSKLGRIASPEEIEANSKRNSGENHPNWGKKRSKETCNRISKARKGNPLSDEHRQSLSLAKKGKPMSDKTKELRKGTWLKGENHPNSKIFLSLNTGIYYTSLEEAAEIYGIKRTTLNNMLTGHRRNKTDLVYAIENESVYVIVPKVREYWCGKHTTESKQRMSVTKTGMQKAEESVCSKLVLDTQTGIFYYCAREAAEAFNIGYKYFCTMLNEKSKKKNKTSLIYC